MKKILVVSIVMFVLIVSPVLSKALFFEPAIKPTKQPVVLRTAPAKKVIVPARRTKVPVVIVRSDYELGSKTIPLKFADAKKMEMTLSKLLLPGELCSYDEQLNAIVLRAKNSSIIQLSKVIADLDKMTEQVDMSVSVIEDISELPPGLTLSKRLQVPEMMAALYTGNSIMKNNDSIDLLNILKEKGITIESSSMKLTANLSEKSADIIVSYKSPRGEFVENKISLNDSEFLEVNLNGILIEKEKSGGSFFTTLFGGGSRSSSLTNLIFYIKLSRYHKAG